MENASLIALSRQVALRRQMDVIANNLANVTTAGFKSQSVLFEEFVMPVAQHEAARVADRDLSYVVDKATLTDFAPGQFEPTGNDLDVAIEGDGWFVVETPDGERYTRDGGFQINAAGELVTGAGFQVLTEGGPVVFEAADGAVAIAADGTVSTEQGVKDRLRIVAFEPQMTLRPDGSNLFAADAEPAPAVGHVVRQGALERSNVRPVVELTRMIQVTRAYASLASVMERTDDLRRDAIGALARLQS